MGNVSQLCIQGLSRKQNRAIDAILKSGAAGGPSRLYKSIQQIREQDPSLSLRRLLKRTAELQLSSWQNPWMDGEKNYVLEHAREFPVADLARRLQRTQSAVYQLLWKYRESAKFQDGYTQKELAEALHVSPRKVRGWVRLGWLTLYQDRIKDRSLVRFLEGHSDEIDAKRLESDVRLWLLDLGFHEDAIHSVRWFRDRKQSMRVHICDRCGRKVHGNAFYRHLKACAKGGTCITKDTDNRRML
jgi:hypothetical protein